MIISLPIPSVTVIHYLLWTARLADCFDNRDYCILPLWQYKQCKSSNLFLLIVPTFICVLCLRGRCRIVRYLLRDRLIDMAPKFSSTLSAIWFSHDKEKNMFLYSSNYFLMIPTYNQKSSSSNLFHSSHTDCLRESQGHTSFYQNLCSYVIK